MTSWRRSSAACAQNGMDIFRIFDALNDVRNLQTAIKAVKECGKHARGEICYTISPVHTVDNFVKMGVELEKMGCDSIGIKDMSGIIQPQIAYHMVKELKSERRHPDHLAHPRHRWAGSGQLPGRDRSWRGLRAKPPSFPSPTAPPSPTPNACSPCWKGIRAVRSFDPEKLAQLRVYFEGVYKELAAIHQPGQRARGQRHPDLPGSWRHALEFPHPAQRAGHGGQVRRRSCGRSRRARSARLDSAGHAHLADRRHAGDDEREVRPLENDLPAGAGHRSWQIRQDSRPDRSGRAATGRKTDRQKASHRTPRGSCSSPAWRTTASNAREKGLPTDDETVVLFAMFPQQVEALFKPQEPAGGPQRPPAPAQPAPVNARRPCRQFRLSRAPSNGMAKRLFVTVNGKRHT